jgi:hypothetical protein
MKIGLIQTQKLGDHIIAMPIANWFVNQGHEVYWPVAEVYLEELRSVAPGIHFLAVEIAWLEKDPYQYLYGVPLQMLQDIGCDRTIPLYPDAGTFSMPIPCDPTLTSLKFDEYKYAVAGVPFSEKWNLPLRRDLLREQSLHQKLGITREYVLVHEQPSFGNVHFELPPHWRERYDIVEMRPLTYNAFDWIHTIEHAAKRVMIDSSFANLTEQLNITGDNYLVIRSTVGLTPVYRNGWKFRWPGVPVAE